MTSTATLYISITICFILRSSKYMRIPPKPPILTAALSLPMKLWNCSGNIVHIDLISDEKQARSGAASSRSQTVKASSIARDLNYCSLRITAAISDILCTPKALPTGLISFRTRTVCRILILTHSGILWHPSSALTVST